VDSRVDWQPLLRTAHPCDHLVQLYTDDGFLARAVVHFLGTGLREGEAAVMVTTPEHLDAFTRALVAHVDVAAARARHQLVAVDAASCLATFMVAGKPDREAFRAAIDPVLDRVRAAGFQNVRLHGEMVNLLRQHDVDATVQLEELWNELLVDRRVALLCAYRIDNFDRHAHRGLLHRISRTHSHLIPVEDYERLDDAVDLAYRDVFGAQGNTAELRDLLVARCAPIPAMPRGQAALHAVQDFKDRMADHILERARFHYEKAERQSARRTESAR